MQKNRKTFKIAIGGLFIAMGIIIPFFTGHAFGVPGTILLPMHIPVLMAGFLLGPLFGGLIGVVTPIVSSVLTGMPPAWPVLPLMIFELGVYGTVTGLLRRKFNLKLYPTLIAAMIAGRVAHGLAFAGIMMPPTVNIVISTVAGIVVTGLPGIVIQLSFIPAMIKLLEKALKLEPKQPRLSLTKAQKQAVEEIASGKDTFILIKDGRISYRTSGRGVRPFLVLLATEEGRQQLEGAIVVDKLIGKGAAMLAVLGNVSQVYGVTMSANGKAYLEANQKLLGYTRCVDMISNRERNGICPIERTVLHLNEPKEAHAKIKETVKELMKKAA